MITTEVLHVFSLPLWGGLFLALTAGPLGAFLVWRRLAFVADAFAHASVLGAVLIASLALPVWLAGLIFVCFATGVAWFFLPRMQGREDSFLILFSGGAMSFGFLVMHFCGLSRQDILRYLTGDLSTLGLPGFLLLSLVCLCTLFFLWWYGRALLAMVVSEELAHIDGVPARFLSLVFFFLLWLFVLVGLQWVGSLLITVCLVCPMLMVSAWVRSPFVHLVAAAGIGGACFLLGFLCAAHLEAPLGPVVGGVMILGVGLSYSLQPFLCKRKECA